MRPEDLFALTVRASSPQAFRTLDLHDHVLQAYIPNFTTNHFRSEPDVERVLDHWLRSSSSILDSSPNFPLREHELREVFYRVMDAIEDTEINGEDISGVSSRILSGLDRQIEEDLDFGGNKAQRLFRCLAEISRAAGSVPLGHLLRTFFLGWLDELEEEDVVDLAGWCWGVKRMFMESHEKEDCLEELLARRPDIQSELRRRGTSWMPSIGRSRSDWPRRRRDAGRSYWDNDIHERLGRLLIDQDYLARLADRERKKVLRLSMRDVSPDRRWRRGRRSIRRSLSDRPLRRSRIPASLSQSVAWRPTYVWE